MIGEQKEKKKAKIVPLIISIGIPLFIGGITSVCIPNMNLIYKNLVKPIFAPPATVFPIIWTILASSGYMKPRLIPEVPSSPDILYVIF